MRPMFVFMNILQIKVTVAPIVIYYKSYSVAEKLKS